MTATKTKRQEGVLDVPKTVVDWIANVRKTNKKFEAASLEQKRVMIALDVLAAIAAKRLKPYSGIYVPSICDHEPNTLRASHNYKVQKHHGDEVSAVMTLHGDACMTCAKGALFVAKLDRLNGVKMWELGGGDPSHHLTDLFSQLQLDLIEAAFEKSAFHARPYYYVDGDKALPHSERSKLFNTAMAFSRGNGAKERLQLIMRNIVQNNGTFKPEKKAAAKGEAAKPGAKKQEKQKSNHQRSQA